MPAFFAALVKTCHTLRIGPRQAAQLEGTGKNPIAVTGELSLLSPDFENREHCVIDAHGPPGVFGFHIADDLPDNAAFH
jgi:hypothetical protein